MRVVFLRTSCERDVEVVQGRKEIGSIARLHWPLRKVRDRFLTSRDGREPGDNRRVVPVFHFSEAPSVTAGFIGFVFDIRIVIKVAESIRERCWTETGSAGEFGK